MKKLQYVLLSLIIAFAPAISYANSPAGWYVKSTLMDGATATITAIKGGGATAMQSVVKHAPAAASVAKNIVQAGGVVAVAYAVSELVGAGVDWVLDPANNRVKYTSKTSEEGFEYSRLSRGSTYYPWRSNPDDVCKMDTTTAGLSAVQSYDGSWRCARADGSTVIYLRTRTVTVTPEEKYIPYSSVAAKVISNAQSGHAPSQDFVKAAAVADVESGAVDSALDAVAVPTTDDTSSPADPSDPSVPFDPSSIIAALKSLMSAIDNMAKGLKAKLETMTVVLSDKIDEMISKQTETNQVINDGMADVVAANDRTGAKVGEIVEAIEALEGNKLDGQVINDAIDKAIADGKTNTADIVAAIEAIEGNTLDGQVINDAVDRVIANDNANAQTANDVVSDSIDAGHADATKVTDAIDAQTDAITQTDPETGEKSLKFPAFCGWASIVCDAAQTVIDAPSAAKAYVDELFAEPPTRPDDKPDIEASQPTKSAQDFDQSYVSFGGQCPTLPEFSIDILGASSSMTFDMTPLCELAVTIRPAIISIAYFVGLGVVASAIRET